MQKFTKIIATIGPACDDIECLKKLFDAGMNVARLNFSHGDFEYFTNLIKKIRQVSPDIALLLDTKGPEVRTDIMINGSVNLVDGQLIEFTSEKVVGNDSLITINYENLHELKKGDKILIDDGLIEAEVISTSEDRVKTKVLNGGNLGSKKTVSFHGHNLNIEFLSEKDKQDIKFGIDQNLDFVAASFVRNAKEVIEMKDFLKKYDSKMKVISKIENQESVNNIKEIVEESDAVMVARGDLGVEIPLELVPATQLEIIRLCNNYGKPVIVATQMLESMRFNPRPTRAEVSDIATAIISGADAIMLSGETAGGKYPVKSVEVMTKIAKEYDTKVTPSILRTGVEPQFKDSVSMFIAKAAFMSTLSLGIKSILTPTESGFTARNISRFKPKSPILAITSDETVLRQLQLSWGVFPIMEKKKYAELELMIKDLVLKGHSMGFINENDRVVITAGHKLAESGHTNILKIHRVSDLL